MDLLESLHVAVFEAIHIKRKNLSKPGVMADFLEEAGVDPEAFAKVFNSFGVRMSLQQADARGRAYRASGVPTLIVNGKLLNQMSHLAILNISTGNPQATNGLLLKLSFQSAQLAFWKQDLKLSNFGLTKYAQQSNGMRLF